MGPKPVCRHFDRHWDSWIRIDLPVIRNQSFPAKRDHKRLDVVLPGGSRWITVAGAASVFGYKVLVEITEQNIDICLQARLSRIVHLFSISIGKNCIRSFADRGC